MRCKTLLRPVATLAAAALFASGASGLTGPETAKKPDSAPLVRMDLLRTAPAEPAAPLRDIFSPGRAQFAPPAVVPPPQVPDESAGDEAGSEAPDEKALSEPALDLTYVGYVTSGRKRIALVVSGGEAVAVAEGEEIVPGIKVEKIGRDRIEVVAADGKKTSVPIQGEQP